MYGLKMKKEYLIEILYYGRMNDARTFDTAIRGRIGLIDTDTYELLGYADLVSTTQITYEGFINWHINEDFDKGKATEYINNLEFTKLQEKCYLYNFENIEEKEIPVIVNPLSEANIWVEFNEEDSTKGYKQVSLFDLDI